tara:strand:- start:443 stop:2581 length:2139 start_codon:yes stop_codon:yes gene_type:complete
MKNYILIDPTKINEEDQFLYEEHDYEEYLAKQKKAAEEAAKEKAAAAAEKKKAAEPKTPPTTDTKQTPAAGGGKKSDSEEKKQDKPAGGGEAGAGEGDEEVLLPGLEQWWKENRSDIVPGEPGARGVEALDEWVGMVGDVFLGFDYSDVYEHMIEGNWSEVYSAIQPNIYRYVDTGGQLFLNMVLDPIPGQEEQPITDEAREIAHNTALGVTSIVVFLAALKGARTQMLEEIIRAGAAFEWDDAAKNIAEERINRGVLQFGKFGKENKWEKKAKAFEAKYDPNLKAKSGFEKFLSLFPWAANSVKRSFTDMGTLAKRNLAGPIVTMPGIGLESILARVHRYNTVKAIAGVLDNEHKKAMAELDVTGKDYAEVLKTKREALQKKQSEIETKSRKATDLSGKGAVETEKLEKQIRELERLEGILKGRFGNAIDRARIATSREVGRFFSKNNFILKAMIRDSVSPKEILKEPVEEAGSDAVRSLLKNIDFLDAIEIEMGVRPMKKGPEQIAKQRASTPTKANQRLEQGEKKWWQTAWNRVKKLVGYLTPGRKTTKMNERITEQDNVEGSTLPKYAHDRLKKLALAAKSMQQSELEDSIKANRAINDEVNKLMLLQANYVKNFYDLMDNNLDSQILKIQSDFSELSGQQTSPDAPATAEPQTQTPVQERKVRVSKEELINLIYEQVKNNTRTHRVNKHHLIELIAEETNKQISRKK